MKLIKKLHENHVLSRAQTKQYKSVQFPNGFNRFLNALIVEQLTEQDPKCLVVPKGYCWVNEVERGGIRLVTSQHPYVNNNSAGDVTVIGDKRSIELVDRLFRLHEVEYYGIPDIEDINIKIEYHDTLNPKLWKLEDDEYQLHDDVLDALNDAALEFYDFLDMPKLDTQDITLTGSSANFNWTSSSDIDLHIVVDLEDVEEIYGALSQQYLNAQRKVWNDQHDIKIKGIPVEFYVQDINEPHHSSGIYSITNKDWVEEPKKEKPDLDFPNIKTKAHQYMIEIDELLNGCNRAAPIEKMMDKLIKMRKAGLEDAGEFSTENYVYKVLRNEGYIDKLANCKTKALDRELSVEEEEWIDIETEKNDPWADIGYVRHSDKSKRPTVDKRTRVNLNVPYSQRETAKKMGAKWDPGIRKWYIITNAVGLKKIPNSWR